VALARALVRRPSVFLFDEPLSNLDAQVRATTRGELIRLHRQLGATMIFVTHDQVEAMSMAQRVAVMNQGRLEQCASPLDVYRTPATRFTAQFVGSPAINLLAGKVEGVGSRQVFVGLATVPVKAPAGPATLGIRPEHLRLVSAAPGTLPGTVTLVEPLGPESIVHVEVATGAELRVRVQGASPASPGDAVHVAVDAESVLVFDQDGRLEGRGCRE
jgi:ABC-type sugar transport system ATPase subunit